MSLNIKNPTTHSLVRELAEATGMTQTAAVEDAVRRRLAELAEAEADGLAPDRVERLARARAIAARFCQELTDEDKARIRHAEVDLYDEIGLPR